RSHVSGEDEAPGSRIINLNTRVATPPRQLATGDQNGAVREERSGGELVGGRRVSNTSECPGRGIIYLSVRRFDVFTAADHQNTGVGERRCGVYVCKPTRNSAPRRRHAASSAERVCIRIINLCYAAPTTHCAACDEGPPIWQHGGRRH